MCAGTAPGETSESRWPALILNGVHPSGGTHNQVVFRDHKKNPPALQIGLFVLNCPVYTDFIPNWTSWVPYNHSDSVHTKNHTNSWKWVVLGGRGEGGLKTEHTGRSEPCCAGSITQLMVWFLSSPLCHIRKSASEEMCVYNADQEHNIA